MAPNRMDDNAAAGIGTMDQEQALELQMVRALPHAPGVTLLLCGSS